MVTEDGQILQRELIKSLSSFSSDIRFGIVYFNTQVLKFPPSGLPAEASAGNKAAAESFVQSMLVGPGSCPIQGLHDTLQFVNRSPAKRNVIIYIGDGWTDCPGYDPKQCAKMALESVARWNQKRVPIHVIVTGSEASEDFPRNLAAMNRGTYKRVVR
jgi:hypothetical protein